MKRKQKIKGFKWIGYIKPSNHIGHSIRKDWIIYGGNFFMELKLPNALKINSFKKLDDKLEKYIKSHGNKLPQQITCTKLQRCQYEELFPVDRRFTATASTIMTYKGIPLKPHAK